MGCFENIIGLNVLDRRFHNIVYLFWILFVGVGLIDCNGNVHYQ